MAEKMRNLIRGDIRRQLFELTWPMIFGMMGVVVFNLVDTYFVGKLGVPELAAMSFSFPVVMFLNSLSQGVGIGTSSLISRNIIHTERIEVRMIASRAILLGVVPALIFVFIGLLTIRPLFIAMGASGPVLNYVQDYMRIWYIGVPFVVIPMIGNNIIRATGDTFTPGMIMVAIAVVNAILDPILIFGFGPIPGMGIKGAAIATVFARATGLAVILIILIKRENLFTFQIGPIRKILSTWNHVLYVAGPASLTMLITPFSAGVINRILSGFGKEAVAAFGVASRVEMFALMVIVALGSVLIIFAGQNLSKRKFNRIFKAVTVSFKFSLIWGTLIYLTLLLAGGTIASVFTHDPAVIRIIKKYFYIIGAGYGLQGLVILSTSVFNGINKPIPSALFSIVRMLVLYVPLSWAGARLLGINGVFWAGLTANLITGTISCKFLIRTLRQLEQDHSRP